MKEHWSFIQPMIWDRTLPLLEIKKHSYTLPKKSPPKHTTVLITSISKRVDEDLLKKLPYVKVVGTFGVGFNHIDLQACKKRGIRVINTPEVLTRSTAEMAIALLFAAARRLSEGSKTISKGKGWSWHPEFLLGTELKGKTAVLVGKGRIGQETGKVLKAIGIRVQYITRQDSSKDVISKLKKAQILSLHMPLTSDTKLWLNKDRLKLLNKDCILINTGRGELIDENALIESLQSKKIAAAGLDVFWNEPHIDKRFKTLDNVFLTPHLGSATHTARHAMMDLLMQGVLRALEKKKVWNEVKL